MNIPYVGEVVACVRPAGVLHVRSAARLLKMAYVQVVKRRRLIAVARGSAGDLEARPKDLSVCRS